MGMLGCHPTCLQAVSASPEAMSAGEPEAAASPESWRSSEESSSGCSFTQGIVDYTRSPYIPPTSPTAKMFARRAVSTVARRAVVARPMVPARSFASSMKRCKLPPIASVLAQVQGGGDWSHWGWRRCLGRAAASGEEFGGHTVLERAQADLESQLRAAPTATLSPASRQST